MTLARRLFLAGCGSFGLAACSGRSPALGSGTADVPPDLRPVRNAEFSKWLDAFAPRASRAGISPQTLDTALDGAGFIPGVITRDRNQIENRRTLEDYLSIAASDERIAKGRAALSRNSGTLRAIDAEFGIEPEIVAAIWGLESQFGERRGTIPVISSTATLAFDGRRGNFYETQLIAALRILDRGDTTARNMVGSWAGAMGHTQFIPTSYQSFAVDFTGDGRRDIWSNDPTDALASTASYLARNRWRKGLKWGAETAANGPAGRTIQPQAGGVRFRVTRNFDVIKTYNNSDFYAIGVGHLADRIAGAGPLQGRFPPDANGLTKADRLEIQRGLAAQGFDVGGIDGVFGKQTETAIRAFQQQEGLTVTGIANPDLLAVLR